jgi:hypothetical protein
MTRDYFSSRTNKKKIPIKNLHSRVASLFDYFQNLDYFKHKLQISSDDNPEKANTLAAVLLRFRPFPFFIWEEKDITEENMFDVLEFLFDHVSQPFSYLDTIGYDQQKGQSEFVEKANIFLKDFDVGFESSLDGKILAVGNDGLESILKAEIVEFDEANVDSKVRQAILKWRNNSLSMDLRREAIRELADVFEWLKKNKDKDLEKVLSLKDNSDIFNIANNFALRHHDPMQKSKYDKEIWYPWMFHFYLATYHASIRLLKKNKIS